MNRYFQHRCSIHLYVVGSVSFLGACFLGLAASRAQSDEPTRITPKRDLQNRWEYDPDIGTNFIYSSEPESAELDLAALGSSDAEERVLAMQAAILASRGKISNRQAAFEVTLDQLSQSLAKNASRHEVLAAASAATALAGNRGQVEEVWQAAAEDPRARRVVEPRLVEFHSPVALDVWRERIAGEVTRYGDLFTALDGIAASGDASDQERLVGLMSREGVLLPLRMAAAKALGAIGGDDIAQLAQSQIGTQGAQSELLTANLLSSGGGPEAVKMLEQIIAGNNQQARVVAFRALIKQDPERARELAETMITSSESNLRLAAVQALNEANDAESFNLQATVLGDPNVNVRETARKNLAQKATDHAELDALAADVIGHYLNSESAAGVEQAIKLAVALGKAGFAPKIIKLVDHPDDAVSIRAAWALQMLELTPDDLAGVHERAQATTQKLVDRVYVSMEEELRTAFLFEALGVHKYEPAHEMLMLYVPKQDQYMKPVTRASALYALGGIWQGRKNPELINALARRMLDNSIVSPEEEVVQYTATTSIGRIGDKEFLFEVEKVPDRPPYPLGMAAEWARKHLSSLD